MLAWMAVADVPHHIKMMKNAQIVMKLNIIGENVQRDGKVEMRLSQNILIHKYSLKIELESIDAFQNNG
jgi:hypothetical protein